MAPFVLANCASTYYSYKKFTATNDLTGRMEAAYIATSAMLLSFSGYSYIMNLIKKDPALLIYAIDNRNEGEIKSLLSSGVNVKVKDEQGRSAIRHAVDTGSAAIVNLVLEYNPDINSTDFNGWTPIMSAADKDFTGMVKILLEKGANTRIANNEGRTALRLAIDAASSGSIKLLLEDKNVNVNSADNKAVTPLMAASAEGQDDTVVLMLENKSKNYLKIDQKDKQGQTALIYAIDKGSFKITDILLKHGADPRTADKKGVTALMHTCKKGSEQLVKLLLPVSDLEVADNDRKTAKQHAATEAISKLVQDYIELHPVTDSEAHSDSHKPNGDSNTNDKPHSSPLKDEQDVVGKHVHPLDEDAEL